MKIEGVVRSIRTPKFLYHWLNYWLPVCAYAALIFYLSSLPKIPGEITANFADWMLHMVEYAVLGVLLLRALGRSKSVALKSRAAILAILIATAYGITDEVHQYFVPGRVMSGFDVMANFFGSVVAVAAVLALLTKSPLFDFFKTSTSPETF